MPNPVPPPAKDETYCVIICVPGPLTKEQYAQFNRDLKSLADKYTGGKVVKVEQTKTSP